MTKIRSDKYVRGMRKISLRSYVWGEPGLILQRQPWRWWEKKLRMEEEMQRPKQSRRFASLELERKQVCDQRRMLRKVKDDRVRAPRQEALQVAADLWRVLR